MRQDGRRPTLSRDEHTRPHRGISNSAPACPTDAHPSGHPGYAGLANRVQSSSFIVTRYRAFTAVLGAGAFAGHAGNRAEVLIAVAQQLVNLSGLLAKVCYKTRFLRFFYALYGLLSDQNRFW